ncbi:MAG: aspartate carbamoyltransferase regulatory subunit [Candidatus Thermoplasmatota archaeon]|nr:aspartate carbamoyltransferase regulatory subunit [Candidatus Thermoplasmatota archaeon]
MARKLKVKPIDNGTVIDHIPAGMAFKILAIISKGRELNKPMTLAINVDSKKMGRKDIIKMEDLEMKKQEVNKIALVAPEATFCIIKDSEVVKKLQTETPKVVKGLVRCANPNCVTNQNEPVEYEFHVFSKKPPRLRCHYCEREVTDIMANLI